MVPAIFAALHINNYDLQTSTLSLVYLRSGSHPGGSEFGSNIASSWSTNLQDKNDKST